MDAKKNKFYMSGIHFEEECIKNGFKIQCNKFSYDIALSFYQDLKSLFFKNTLSFDELIQTINNPKGKKYLLQFTNVLEQECNDGVLTIFCEKIDIKELYIKN